ncbi:MAG: helix-turn-helix transcriptional regulator [Candidatus Sericytochromatia bacterium]
MSAQSLRVELKVSEALFLLLSAKLNHEFLESIQIQDQLFGETEMGALIQKLEHTVGPAYAELTDEVLEELINSFLPEVPIHNVGLADYSFPMYNIDETLPRIHEALDQSRVLRMEYYSMDREEINQREVEPYFLEKRYNYYILMAYCRWREDIRLFRVDRIKSLEVLSELFDKPADFQAGDYREDDHV